MPHAARQRGGVLVSAHPAHVPVASLAVVARVARLALTVAGALTLADTTEG